MRRRAVNITRGRLEQRRRGEDALTIAATKFGGGREDADGTGGADQDRKRMSAEE
jgi:hypothetical protein